LASVDWLAQGELKLWKRSLNAADNRWKIVLNGKVPPNEPAAGYQAQNRVCYEDRRIRAWWHVLPYTRNINLINAQHHRRGYLTGQAQSCCDNNGGSEHQSQQHRQICELASGRQPAKRWRLPNGWTFSPEGLIFDEPTRGIDIGAKTEIYSIMEN